MQFAQRLDHFKFNVFAEMDQAKAEAIALGQDLIDLSLGSSDLPVSPPVLERIQASLGDPATHGYALFQSTQPFRQAAARWYTQKYGVSVDPETEVLQLIGCQEGTAHLPLAILNPGDFALLQDPSYPSHSGGVHLAGGQVYSMPLRAEDQFLPRFEQIPAAVLAQSRLMILSYPHNPTTAIAPLSFFQTAVQFCRTHHLVLVHDFPYGDFVFTRDQPVIELAPSVLQADPDKTVAIEFFTFSKSFNMGGFRIGFAVGNQQLIRALRQIKSVVDFNQYRGILNGAIAALKGSQELIQDTVHTFQTRRDVFVDQMRNIGWDVPLPEATLYIWAKLPQPWEQESVRFCTDLVRQTGVAASPGIGFGKSGEGYVRFALVHPPERLVEAVDRIAGFLNGESVA
ncbi:MAG: LL-diaminopimelate aminotransferase [Oscillatoriales cyanobacterium RM2_1_1]|nr:LL-diaminopimelate aminotransferase [Oscillatoriales cyanobacterium SM2_3_0]NJO45340.1 LL-diaminopimelate aminotransferase [Oscillatoriales cyanobacterium RM2_1_1]